MHRPRRLAHVTLVTLLALASLVLTACAVAQEEEEIASGSDAIRGGTVTTDFPAVGMIGIHGDSWTCTATLLDATTLITAAHCAFSTAPHAPATPVQVGQLLAAPDFRFYPRALPSGLRDTSGAVAVTAMFALGDGDAQSNDNPDVMLMKLASPITLPSYPTLATELPAATENLVAVGFGCANDGVGFWTKRTRDVHWRVPLAVSELFVGANGHQEGLLSRTNIGVLCPGDSGGPLLRAGAREILGIAYAGSAERSLWANVPLLTAPPTGPTTVPSVTTARSILASGTAVCRQGKGTFCSDGWGRTPTTYAAAETGKVVSLQLATCDASGRLIAHEACPCIKERAGTADHCR